jgi:hypothetical protein
LGQKSGKLRLEFRPFRKPDEGSACLCQVMS